ncbi:MAG: prepilin-type N-terminal cleavage/methylation domain-containing protein [Burkholderiaceae bacterium]|nr:prepilin-type N-terminal cleavage/methylation domain-containing protein [Burkholderiaceae bacterium]
MISLVETPGRPSHRLSPQRERGFGLLEAIVAMTILATGGAALFAWIAQNLEAASRLKQHEARVQQQLQAESLLATVNPSVEPQGERRLAGLMVRWQSELVAPLRPSLPLQLRQQVRWRVGLYRLRVELQGPDPALNDRFEVLQTGLEPVGVKADGARTNAP